MRKTFLVLMVVIAVMIPAMITAQDEGAGKADDALFPSFSLESTWINMFNYDDPFFPASLSATLSMLLPASMPAYVSSGMFYDEIDIIFRHPAELANYSGYSIFTAYGNTDYDKFSTGTPLFVNPFTTGTITQTGGGANLNYMLLGYVLPILNFRTGILGGYTLAEQENLNVSGGASTTWSNTQTIATDADVNNVVDSTVVNTQDYTDFTNTTNFTGGAGMNLGFMGVSLFMYVSSVSRNLGGSYTHTYTPGEVAAANDAVTGKTVYYGTGTNGALALYPSAVSSWGTKVTGELPLNIAGISMPVTANLYVNGTTGPTAGKPLVASPPMTVSLATTNVTGAAGGATSTSSINYTVGQTMNTGWNPNTISGVLGGVSTYTQAQFRALLATELGASSANDAANTSQSDFTMGASGDIDPKFSINENFKVKTRGSVSYGLSTSNNSQNGTRSITYSEANATSATNSAFSFSETYTIPMTMTSNTIGLELGGILEFTDNGFLTVGTGLFYTPSFTLNATTRQNAVITQNYSWKDETNTDAVATAATTIASQIVPGSFQGSSSQVQTVTYSGEESTSSTTHNFYIPVSVKLNLVKNKLGFIAGYILNHVLTTTQTKTPASTSTTATTVNNTSGTAVYSSPATASSTTTTAGRSDVTVSPGAWSGNMSFMLRWIPAKPLTVDFFGSMLMNALNFSIFGSGGGFNPRTFINNLGISATIHID